MILRVARIESRHGEVQAMMSEADAFVPRSADPMGVSVVVITANRPAMLRGCLEAIENQQYPVEQIIVVDASTDGVTEQRVREFPAVRYIRSRIMNMPAQRNMGIRLARGEIVAFVDDDAIASPGWLGHIVSAYTDETIGCVGGYVDEGTRPAGVLPRSDEVGRFYRDGTMTANFDFMSEGVLSVDHVQGCNMSFRKRVLTEVGGFDPTYRGTCIYEETDLCLRIKAAGYGVRYSPRASVKHLLAEGRGHSRDRYNLKFQYYHARNKSYLFFRNRGLGPATLGFLIRDTWVHLHAYSVRIVHTLALIAVSFAGKAVGAALTVRQLLSASRGLDEAPDQTSQ